MNIIKRTFLTVAFLVINILFLDTSLSATYIVQMQYITKQYENKVFNISLEYSADWKPNPNYKERYEGKDGFFQITAYTGKGLKIDEVVQNEVTHVLKPYGNTPKITQLTIQGREARLILPSNDQLQDFKNQAELIIKYPKEIYINNNTYNYLILWADKNNIQSISKTIKFIT